MTADNPGADQPEKRPYRKTPPATPAVQAGLDGEAEKDRPLNPDEEETAALWTRINSETERLRRRPLQGSLPSEATSADDGAFSRLRWNCSWRYRRACFGIDANAHVRQLRVEVHRMHAALAADAREAGAAERRAEVA